MSTPYKYTHVQSEQAKEWEINHSLLSMPFVFVYDKQGNLLAPIYDMTIDPGVVRLQFLSPMSGICELILQDGIDRANLRSAVEDIEQERVEASSS